MSERTITVGIARGMEFPDSRNECRVNLRLEKGVFSAAGEVWMQNKKDIISGGQNLDELGRLFPDNSQLQRIIGLWEKWHLNDMRAGCKHQRAEGWEKRPIDPTKPLDSYGRHGREDGPMTWNMLTWVRPEEHPEGLMTVPCPVCGYRYGTEWLREEIDPADLAEIERLIGGEV